MSETKTAWTPGTWMAAAKPSSVVGWPIVASPMGRSICSVTYVQHNQIDPVVAGDRAFNIESRANAHLIAAAPDLYAALDECLKEHGGFTIKGECERRALAALARARGEKP